VNRPDIFRICNCDDAPDWPHIHLGGPTHHYGVEVESEEHHEYINSDFKRRGSDWGKGPDVFPESHPRKHSAS
jgi:hypothetical protein